MGTASIAKLKTQLENILGTAGTIVLAESMKRHTTFHAGGEACMYVTLQEESYELLANVIACIKASNIPFLVIGRGSNLLVSDRGYEGVIIDLSASFQSVTIDGNKIYAKAGATLGSVATKAMMASLTGFEFAAGIPGTIGGAIAMNAGAYGGEMKDVVKYATVLTWKDVEYPVIQTLSLEELQLAYRHSRITETEEIVLDVTMELATGDEAVIKARMEELRDQRMTKQPLEYPSAGSTFKRPTGYFAGKLVMDAGLAGYRVGGAMVSPKHCGFVINYDQATASDIYQLCKDVHDKVMELYGVSLELEVKLVGIFE